MSFSQFAYSMLLEWGQSAWKNDPQKVNTVNRIRSSMKAGKDPIGASIHMADVAYPNAPIQQASTPPPVKPVGPKGMSMLGKVGVGAGLVAGAYGLHKLMSRNDDQPRGRVRR